MRIYPPQNLHSNPWIWTTLRIWMDFPLHDRHKTDRAALRLSCGVWFEALACVFASAGARSMFANMEEYRLRQTLVHRKVDYMHSMAYLCAPRVFWMTLGAHQSPIYLTRCILAGTKVWGIVNTILCKHIIQPTFSFDPNILEIKKMFIPLHQLYGMVHSQILISGVYLPNSHLIIF